jgi:hypothetical protein
MSWQEFVNQCQLVLPDDDEHVVAPRMDTSCSGPVNIQFPNASVQKLYEALQQQRAQCAEQFVHEFADMAKERHNQYSVSKQVWDRSTDIPLVADRLMQIMNEPFACEEFMCSMKEWHQHCKDEARLSWYVQKRRYLEQDLDIAKQHTQTLRDEVQRMVDMKRKCRTVSQDMRDSSQRMACMGDLHDMKQAYQDLADDELRRTHEDRDHIHKCLPEQRGALDAEQQRNAELERKIQEMKQEIEHAQSAAKVDRQAALQEQMRRSSFERQLSAYTCMIHKAVAGAVCLKLRSNVKLWVEKPSLRSSEFVRVAVPPEVPPPAHSQTNPCIAVSSKLRYGLLACAWCRILVSVTSSSFVNTIGSLLESPDKGLEAIVPCQELQRFLRLFDTEVLGISKQLQSMQSIQKDVPEVAHFAAELCNSTSGDQPKAVLTVLLSVLRSHSVLAGGVLKPHTAEAQAGKFDAVECVVKLSADLLASSKETSSWSVLSIEPVLGNIDRERATQAAQHAVSGSNFGKALAAAVELMKS